MKTFIGLGKIVLAISLYITGGYLSAYAYTTAINPQWFGESLFTGGIIIALVAILYLVIKAVKFILSLFVK
jgi:hypothetical protein